ncbi:MAG: DUF7619 domain-containing protein [Bacteroidota bacterium]
MKKIILLSLLLSVNFFYAQMTIRLKPDAAKGKDGTISNADYNDYPNNNFGDHVAMTVSAWTWGGAAGVADGLIDFNWSLLPPNATVSSSILKMYAFNGEQGSQEFHSELSGSNEAWVERITSPWEELSVTWNTRPTTTDLNRVFVNSSDSVNQDFEVDVTTLLNDILQNPAQGHGFYWKLQNENYYRRLGFCTSDVADASKWPEISITFEAPGVMGIVFHENNQNCTQDNNENALANRLVSIQPGNYIAQTNDAGLWHAVLPAGTYTATLLEESGWINNCAQSYNFTVTDINEQVIVPAFGLTSAENCTRPNISVYSNILRRCFSGQEIYVSASNTFEATADMENAYAEITLDPLFTLDSASLPFLANGNTFHFNLGTLSPDETVNFTLYVTLSCDAVLLETLCHEARLFPAEDCNYDTIPDPFPPGVTPCSTEWDHSSLTVTGTCGPPNVYFTIINHGEDMTCYAPVRIYRDGVLFIVDSILLLAGQSANYSFPSEAQTWILQADQHPLHPGNSHPNVHIEACGDLVNWQPMIVNDFPQDDADPMVDIFCTVTNGSYDPNDKRGFPSGLTENHYIRANQDLEYIIRFQNTGTDTAFTVVVRDTLDENLDISSIELGNVSHPYSFRIYGQRVLEWTFNTILLVDSTTNEPLSHGHIQFSVKQNPDLAPGTILKNDADIYFDFNVPVITNETSHIINEEIYLENLGTEQIEDQDFVIYPNPANESLNIISKSKANHRFHLTDLSGKTIMNGKITANNSSIDVSALTNGAYIIVLESGQSRSQYKIIKTN